MKIAELKDQLEAKIAELLQLSETYGELNDELSQVKLQHGAETTASDDLKSVARACERPAKRAKATRSC